MKKSDLRNIIRESIKQLMNENLPCLKWCAYGYPLLGQFYCCKRGRVVVSVDDDEDQSVFDIGEHKTGGCPTGCYCKGGMCSKVKIINSLPTTVSCGVKCGKGSGTSVPQGKEGDNECKQQGFCCKNKNKNRYTTAVSEYGSCTCTGGSVRVNCPK